MKKLLLILLGLTLIYFPGISLAVTEVVHDPILQAEMVVQFGKDITELGHIFDGLNEVKKQLNSDLIDPLQKADLITLNLRNDLQTLASILKKNTQYAYQSSSASKDTFFAGYKTLDGKTYQSQYADIANNLQNLLNNVLASLQTNAEHFDIDSQNLQDMQSRANAAQTQMQIAQSAAQIAAEGVNQMQLLRQTVVAQTNAQTAYYAAQTQKEASANQAFDTLVNEAKTGASSKLDQSPLDSSF